MFIKQFKRKETQNMKKVMTVMAAIAVAAVVAVVSGVTLGSLENMMAAVRPIA